MITEGLGNSMVNNYRIWVDVGILKIIGTLLWVLALAVTLHIPADLLPDDMARGYHFFFIPQDFSN